MIYKTVEYFRDYAQNPLYKIAKKRCRRKGLAPSKPTKVRQTGENMGEFVFGGDPWFPVLLPPHGKWNCKFGAESQQTAPKSLDRLAVPKERHFSFSLRILNRAASV
jgi:hypothetical protein